ncbi:putative peptide/nitrate transporter [Panicum miliaceum]|uniref:Peptide/nitrate transporter n=1 Tax=Panicum miliaceum TaxID=4540 RepID=A0A3L6SSI3_PANMI|nr:putative peptide/nitrate transporter [Panicum miliaceum]
MDGVGEAARWREGCPGCKQERRVQASDRLPYREFLYIWIACLCASMVIYPSMRHILHVQEDRCVHGEWAYRSWVLPPPWCRTQAAAARRPEAAKKRPLGALTGARRRKGALPIQSLFPYLYFMIRDLKIAKQEQDIGFYAGFVGATYFLARTFSSVPWGIFADKYGRKPCIVISILSVIVFNTLFGLSTSYWMAIVTRGLLGLLCGILGPIKAYATEVCRKEHQALGISLVTSSRAIALVIGPAIGGFLAQPAEKYPNLFSKESIFGRFPYFLPSLVISILAAVSCIACIWLPETLHFHDDEKVEAIDALEAQVADSNIEGGKPKEASDTSTKNLLMNWQLMSATFSLWAVSSRKFRGLSLTSQDVGTVLAVSGVGVLIYQLAVYPFLVKYFGAIRPLRPAAATITTACNILQNTAVAQEQRGVANGISVTLMSLFKGVAPAAAGILFSWAQKNMTGLFLPGDQILFLMINMVSVIGLLLTFKPFFNMSRNLRRS